MPLNRRSSRLRLALAGLALSALATAAGAATHALVMTIGEYADRRAKLLGVLYDEGMALRIAERMGATNRTTTVLSNRQLDAGSMVRAFEDLRRRVRRGDTVFVYYSGHGTRVSSVLALGTGCQEGIVGYDNVPLLDQQLADHLLAIAAVADRVVMLNDSCHSGGAVSKGFDPKAAADGDFEIKAHPGAAKLPGGAGASADASCSRISNPLEKSVRSFGRDPDEKIIYLAASDVGEVAWSTPTGSLATQAWHHCLGRPDADKDGDGWLSGHELATCANEHVRSQSPRNGGRSQRVTPLFNLALPVVPAAPRAR